MVKHSAEIFVDLNSSLVKTKHVSHGKLSTILMYIKESRDLIKKRNVEENSIKRC